MKKLFVLAAVLVCAFSTLQAQSGFALGVKLGANLTKIDGVRFRDAFNTSYQAGAFAELNLSDKWGIQPELLFSQTTSKMDTSLAQVVGFHNTRDVKLNYLSIPILLRYNINKFITLNAGPQFSILMNRNDNLWSNGKSAFKGGDFAMVAGLQVNISSFRIYGRYNIGLTNISDVDNSGKWKHQQIQLGVGLKLL